jgi:hypothetical protein
MYVNFSSPKRSSANIGEIPIDEAGGDGFNAATLSPVTEGKHL